MKLASPGVGVGPLSQEALVLHLLSNDPTRYVNILAPYDHLQINGMYVLHSVFMGTALPLRSWNARHGGQAEPA